MQVIEDWIDHNVSKLIEDREGYIALSNTEIDDLALKLFTHNKMDFFYGLTDHAGTQKGVQVDVFSPTGINAFKRSVVTDFIFWMVDQHKDYFQKQLKAYALAYEQEERETHKVETM
tara:strand:- start:2413 stop:2763 length:351 start_codon:yes stop_codon:yes gene_type:complete